VTGKATSLRLLLLLLVLTGVAGMHTIGHPVGADHSTSGHSSVAASANGHGSEPTDVMPADTIPADATQVAWRVDEHGTGVVMNPLDFCIAILVAGILLLLAAALGRMRRGGAYEHHIVATMERAGRGPPSRVRFGLTLADLSVQRT
jgi:Family of unknown function (DUF6153)